MASGVNPVFLKRRDIPLSDSDSVSVLEVCLAAERVSGRESVLGAQEIRGLWRIYAATREARNTLLVQGLSLRNVALKVCGENPFSLRDNLGIEKPSTKVFIDNLPLSVADSEIENSLVSLGCELRSGVKQQRARDKDGKLTRFLTGGRFVFITVPPVPLEKTMTVSIFTAAVYHREQKSVPRKVVCSKCLLDGHHVSVCENEVVCRDCRLPGHRRGSPDCQTATEKNSETETATSHEPAQTEKSFEAETTTDEPVQTSDRAPSSTTNLVTAPDFFANFRPSVRTPRSATLSAGSRSRSGSVKRHRSQDRNRDFFSQPQKQQKCADVNKSPANVDNVNKEQNAKESETG